MKPIEKSGKYHIFKMRNTGTISSNNEGYIHDKFEENYFNSEFEMITWDTYFTQ